MAPVVAERRKWWILGLCHITPRLGFSVKVSAVGEQEAEGAGLTRECRERRTLFILGSVKANLAAVINKPLNFSGLPQ